MLEALIGKLSNPHLVFPYLYKPVSQQLIILSMFIGIVFAGVALLGVITYFKMGLLMERIVFTTIDHKKIGTIIVALVMMFRGFVDAAMLINISLLVGDFAGLTFWFPKIFGFKLNERLGEYVFWCCLVGFFVAFMPLYILYMGMTRRLYHYGASTGYQSLLIVAWMGALIIGLGIFFQVLQIIVSIKQRDQNVLVLMLGSMAVR